MSKSAKGLDELSKELSETVNRLDQLQKKPPLRQRISRHFGKQGSNIVGVVLAGTLFSVALDRLAQKRNYEVCLCHLAGPRLSVQSLTFEMQTVHPSDLRHESLSQHYMNFIVKLLQSVHLTRLSEHARFCLSAEKVASCRQFGFAFAFAFAFAER